MKKIAIIIILAVILIGAVIAGGYYWNKRQNEPPHTVEYKNIGEVDKDIARFEPLQRAGRLKWQDMYQLGVAYIKMGRAADAATTLEDVVKRHPDFYKTYESLGMAYYSMGELEKAAATWEKAVKMSPQAAHLEGIIDKVRQMISLKKSISTLEQEIQQGNVGWEKRFQLAVHYIGMRRVEDAKAQLEEVVKVKKDSYEVYDAIAQAYAMSGDFEKALDAEKKAVKLKPKDERLKNRLAEIEKLRQGMKKEEHQKKQ